MSKKNLGRVKRYRSSFYRSRRFWLRRFLSGAVALAVIFALGWFIGPAVINFGTHTWYSLKDGGREDVYKRQILSKAGPIRRQYTHQGAMNSTRAGCFCSSTWVRKEMCIRDRC